MAYYFSEPSHTFNEYLLVPGYSSAECIPANVSLRTPIVKYRKGEESALYANIPMVSAIMQAVSDDRMAIALAQEGGISFIYGSQTIESEAAMVARVKSYKAGFIVSDSNLRPEQTLADVLALKARTGHSTMAVTEDGTSNGKLLGIVTSRDYRVSRMETSVKVSEFMTPFDKLITAPADTTLKTANDIIWDHKLNSLPLVDDEQHLVYLVFRKDYDSHKANSLELLDEHQRYVVGAGINTRDYAERVPALVEAGADVLCIDSSEGFSEWQSRTLAWIRENYGDSVKVGAGNVVDREGFRFLADAGADFVKVGIGGGSICITREQKGIGRGQATALIEVAAARDEYFLETGVYVPICSDGGIVHDYHCTLALAMGADFLMLGRYFSRFDESPTNKVNINGSYMKEYWGEGSARARNWQRYDMGGEAKLSFEEGVDSYVPYAGSLKDNLGLTLSKVRSTMCNCGALSIPEFQKKAKITLVSATSIVEGGAHGVDLRRSHRQGGDTQAREDQCQQRITTGLATHADRLARRTTAVAGVADHLEDRGLPRIQERRQVAVQTVGSHRVLRQVVRADGGEVHDRQELLGAQGGRGHLDHDADLGQAVASCLVGEPLGFISSRDHGGHDPQLRARRLVGGGQSLQLRVDEVLSHLAQAQAAHAQGGVLFGTQIREAQRLVGARIEGTHDDATVTEGLQDLRVGVGLLLQRRGLRTFQEQELRAEQARALEVELRGLHRVVNRADVGQELDGVAVVGRALAGRACQGERAATRAFLEQVHLVIGGGDDDLADTTVEGQHRAFLDTHDALGLDDRRDAQLGSQDRRVRGRTTDLGDDAEDGLRVRQVACHEDDGAIEGRDAGLGQATQLADRAVAHVVEVGRALGHVAAQAAQHLRVVLDSVVDGLGDTEALLQLLVNGLGQATVTRELGGGLEDRLRLFRGVCGAVTQTSGNGRERLTDTRAVGGSVDAARLRRVDTGGGLDDRGGSCSGTGGDADAVQDVVRRHQLTPGRGRARAARRASRAPRPRNRPR